MKKITKRFLTIPRNTNEFMKSSIITNDLASLRRSLIYRSGNLGMLELDIVIGKWAQQNIPNFTLEECKQYANEVISKETPDLYRLILGDTEISELPNEYYIKRIKQAIGK